MSHDGWDIRSSQSILIGRGIFLSIRYVTVFDLARSLNGNIIETCSGNKERKQAISQ